MPALQVSTPALQAAWDRHQPQFRITPPQQQQQQQQQQQARDVSSLHPVFFTGRLRRSAPAAGGILPAATSSLLNPVAYGYVYRDERLMRRPGGGPML
ncbi:hypothetical protein SAMD00023353_1800590 [Rosellinia necatrix]|uniref:Uncharacterized protein n=1 Tax=Rosellinia necatrix TaxID=77044 RepID=A0A1W2TEB1_ROSNE|nr:hypothetical protein SAMD00023353_1800590 [Rosellinia necatrix]